MAVVSKTLWGFCLLRSRITIAPACPKKPSNERARYLSLLGHILMSDTCVWCVCVCVCVCVDVYVYVYVCVYGCMGIWVCMRM
jgi:hypothetical protein